MYIPTRSAPTSFAALTWWRSGSIDKLIFIPPLWSRSTVLLMTPFWLTTPSYPSAVVSSSRSGTNVHWSGFTCKAICSVSSATAISRPSSLLTTSLAAGTVFHAPAVRSPHDQYWYLVQPEVPASHSTLWFNWYTDFRAKPSFRQICEFSAVVIGKV